MILGATDQKLWMFEVLRISLGRAGMYWSQPARVDHLRTKWRAGEKKFKKKQAVWPYPGIGPYPGVDSRPAWTGPDCPFFVNFFYLI
jgi:hypothetical protein